MQPGAWQESWSGAPFLHRWAVMLLVAVGFWWRNIGLARDAFCHALPPGRPAALRVGQPWVLRGPRPRVHNQPGARASDPWPHSEAVRFHRVISLSVALVAAPIRAADPVRNQGPAEVTVLGAVLATAVMVARPVPAAFRASPANFPAPATAPPPRSRPDPSVRAMERAIGRTVSATVHAPLVETFILVAAPGLLRQETPGHRASSLQPGPDLVAARPPTPPPETIDRRAGRKCVTSCDPEYITDIVII